MPTTEEMLLTALANGTTIAEFQPQNNKQAYLAYLCGARNVLPTPRTVEEALLYNLCVNGGSSGGSADYEITHCDYLFEGDRGELYEVWLPHIKSPESTRYMFYYSTGNPEIDMSGLDCSQCEDFTSMFYARIDVSNMDMSNIRSSGANYMFAYCEAEEIIGIGRNANINYNFRDFLMGVEGKRLRRLTISPYAKGMNQYVDISNCQFDREGMVEFFESLPATCTSTIKITGNPCVTDGTLTDEDRAIATGKGCTLTEA